MPTARAVGMYLFSMYFHKYCPSAIFGVKGGSCTYYNNNVVWKHNGSWATWYNVYIDPAA